MSCRTLSATIVSARTRLSAKATSEGILGLRLWQTMIMSNSSATELTPQGSVGLVELVQDQATCCVRRSSCSQP